MLPYKCIGLQIGYVYLHHCMCHYIINISPKSISNMKFLTSECFFPCHYRHIRGITFTFSWTCRLYSFLSLCGCSVFSVIWPKYHKRFGNLHKLFDSTANASLRHSSPLLKYKKNISLYKYSDSLGKKPLYLLNQQFLIYLQTANKLRCSKMHATLHSRERWEE